MAYSCVQDTTRERQRLILQDIAYMMTRLICQMSKCTKWRTLMSKWHETLQHVTSVTAVILQHVTILHSSTRHHAVFLNMMKACPWTCLVPQHVTMTPSQTCHHDAFFNMSRPCYMTHSSTCHHESIFNVWFKACPWHHSLLNKPPWLSLYYVTMMHPVKCHICEYMTHSWTSHVLDDMTPSSICHWPVYNLWPIYTHTQICLSTCKYIHTHTSSGGSDDSTPSSALDDAL